MDEEEECIFRRLLFVKKSVSVVSGWVERMAAYWGLELCRDLSQLGMARQSPYGALVDGKNKLTMETTRHIGLCMGMVSTG